MADDREFAKKCAFDARTLLNDMQGNGHIDELKLLKSSSFGRCSAGPGDGEDQSKKLFATRPPR